MIVAGKAVSAHSAIATCVRCARCCVLRYCARTDGRVAALRGWQAEAKRAEHAALATGYVGLPAPDGFRREAQNAPFAVARAMAGELRAQWAAHVAAAVLPGAEGAPPVCFAVVEIEAVAVPHKTGSDLAAGRVVHQSAHFGLPRSSERSAHSEERHVLAVAEAGELQTAEQAVSDNAVEPPIQVVETGHCCAPGHPPHGRNADPVEPARVEQARRAGSPRLLELELRRPDA